MPIRWRDVGARFIAPAVLGNANDMAHEHDNADYQINPAIRRGRFIAPTADLSAFAGFPDIQIKKLRHGANELDSSSSTERSSPVMLSAAKHLSSDRDRPFAELTLSEANVLRVTLCDCSNCQGLFFTIEPCLKSIIGPLHQGKEVYF